MPQNAKLLAWIEQGEQETFVAAYVGSGARERAPATQACSSPDEARDWIETQADELGVPVEWVPATAGSHQRRTRAANVGTG